VLSKEQREDLAENITLFCDLYRAALQRTQATPKLHTLEAHFVEFMEAWHTLGIFGEDAMESLHAKLNVIFLRVHGIRNRVAKLKSAWGLLDQSQHGAALAVAAEINIQAKRKFKESDEERKARREKKKVQKDEQRQQQPQQPLLEQQQKKPKQEEQKKRKQLLDDKFVQREEEQKQQSKKTKKKKEQHQQQQQQQQQPKAKAKPKVTTKKNKKAPAKKQPQVAKPKKSKPNSKSKR
jgi:flagellar biosynthesis GTPase FlhF